MKNNYFTDILNSESDGNDHSQVFDGEELYRKSRVVPEDVHDRPIIALAIIDKGEIIAIGTTKSAIVIQGEAKAGKGKTYSFFIVACLTGMFGPIRSDLVGRKVIILHSDDNRSNLARLGLEISRLSGINEGFHENLIIMDICQYGLLEKYAVLEATITKHPDIGVLVLDLAWDWLDSVNDETASKYMLDKFLGLALKHDFFLIIVTHSSRGRTGLAKGHQGAHWIAKSSATLNVKKKRDRFIVTPLYTRGREFGAIHWSYDGDQYTFHESTTEKQQTLTSRKARFEDVLDNVHLQILSTVLTQGRTWEPAQLRDRLRVEYGKMIAPIGVNLSKYLLKYYRDKGWIKKQGRQYSGTV